METGQAKQPVFLSTWLSILLFVFGFALGYIGWKISVTPIIFFGLLPIGTAVVMWGIESIRKKYSSYDSSVEGGGSGYYYSYTGIAAVMDGITLTLLGAAIFITGFIGLFNLQGALISYMKARPGFAMLFAGIFMISASVTQIFGAREENRMSFQMLMSIPKRIFSILVLFLGITLGLAGCFEILMPMAFDRSMDGLVDKIRPPVIR